MSNRPIKLYVDDIKEAIQKIELYTKGMTFDEFKDDSKTIDAVIRNIEVIGEAAKHIPTKIRLMHIEIPWKEIVGTRSKVIHEYFGVDVYSPYSGLQLFMLQQRIRWVYTDANLS